MHVHIRKVYMYEVRKVAKHIIRKNRMSRVYKKGKVLLNAQQIVIKY